MRELRIHHQTAEDTCSSKDKREMLAESAELMSNIFVKILKVNLTLDTHENIKVAAEELDVQNGYSDKTSQWFAGIAKSGQIQEEDRMTYLSFCNMDYLKQQLWIGSRFLSCHYRRKIHGKFRWVSMEMIPGKEYTDENQVVFLYIRDIHEDYLRQLNFAMGRAKNALSVCYLNLTENLYVSGYGDYGGFVMPEGKATAEEYLSLLGRAIEGAREYREFQKEFSRNSLLAWFEEDQTVRTFQGSFILEQEKRRFVKITVEMERNTFTQCVEALLYTADVTEEYLKSTFIPKLYQFNFLAIGVIDIRRGTIAMNKGTLKDISQLIDAEESYADVRRRVSEENIASVDREAYLKRTTLENLKENLEENDYYGFPIYYEEDGERTIKNYRYSYLSKELGLLIATVEDVTSLSEKDALTSGPNQQGFIKEVCALLEPMADKSKYAILCMDVKGFKAINELFGILEGNDLLRALHKGVEESFLEPVITARVEADQYLCLVEREKLDYEKLLDWCEQDYLIKGKPFRIFKRCGIYPIQNTPMPVRSMCDRARIALSLAKSERSVKPYVIFDDAMSADYIDKSEILGQFDSSLKNREFSIYVQPVVESATGRISSAEALVRWNHPEKGFVSPQSFISALEGNGYISRLDLYVAQEVEKFQLRREQEGRLVVPISVNLSWMDFYDGELLEWLENYVESQKEKEHTIRFEITETSYAAVAENKNPLLERIRQDGATFLLDDFGCGYSSFSTLQNYDFDILKLDIGFVSRIEQNDKTKSIIDSIIKMVHQMDARIVAEGAETQNQVEFLKSRGCDYVQGYYFYKPMPLDEFEKILDAQEV